MYRPEQAQRSGELWPEDGDAAPANVSRYPWLAVYQQAGRNALRGYLGTEKEIDFDQVGHIVSDFKQARPRCTSSEWAARPPSCGMTQWT